ncbi:putative glycosidase [Flavihumibacter petaseus NBRC 106054]|uniref:Putative glycosidase n=2 Tax=Flavihumibacter TaxID=1004301 RepID=A0A0E9MY51_9BACT|nr:putative glycosidase [Flavihumibacter petaseus NBRC 106054]
MLVVISKLQAQANDSVTQWIRINQLGYQPKAVKVAVWCSKEAVLPGEFVLEAVDAEKVENGKKGKIVFRGKSGKAFGAYGPFEQTARLDFSSFTAKGTYRIRMGNAISPVFVIDAAAYAGTPDFCLRYMRQQRSGFNPFLRDSCHTGDGYTLYGPMPDSSFVPVTGGWHDASDYLQYAITSANATYHLLMAFRDFPKAFGDDFAANGLPGNNGITDVMDEARWGIDWLLKMHPRADWMFNQIADDRDHAGMRIPGRDTFYGKADQRPVYFINGLPQQRGKFLNQTKGTSSTAAKFASAFALGNELSGGFYPSGAQEDAAFSVLLAEKANTALAFAYRRQGVTQTASVRAPYIYAEENWTDDMELAHASLGQHTESMRFAKQETITPWLGADTAAHYQWYPFINIGHGELARKVKGTDRSELIRYYKEGIQRVVAKAGKNAFNRGIPFIWCSNNLTVAFAIQCRWYRELSGDQQFRPLEQACIDWLFGLNPWGTSMVYGLPAHGDNPVDPHSGFTHLKQYPIDGGLVDGPVYTTIFKSLIGLTLNDADEYAAFQSDLAVYHDDYGDYSTNEPTMDGTASLIYLLAGIAADGDPDPHHALRGLFGPAHDLNGIIGESPTSGNSRMSASPVAITRLDSTKKEIALVFTGHDYANSGHAILVALQDAGIRASFFLTGDFCRKKENLPLLHAIRDNGHYLGPHSDKHLLYNDWKKRDSLLVTREQFRKDLTENISALATAGADTAAMHYFLPAYEWYNDSITEWTKQSGRQLVNYTPGTLSHADYTEDTAKNFRDNTTIFKSITDLEQQSGLNGYILLMHIGAAPGRKTPFAAELPALLTYLKKQGYTFVRF